MVDFPKKTQKQLLLDLLMTKGSMSNYELRSLQPPIFQYPVRIHELQKEGHPIYGKHDENDHKKYWYVYQPQPRKDLFL